MSKVLDDKLTKENLLKLSEQYGNAFYLLDPEAFRNNFIELSNAFKTYYPKFNIAYSYKTNYIPKLVKIVNELGGYAEIVSEMEEEIALRSGVSYDHIIWNGPIKNAEKMEDFLLHGGTVNIDSVHEADIIRDIANRHKDFRIHVGVRCNFDVEDGVLSRFGVDTNGCDFDYVLNLIKDTENIELIELQCHFAKRLVKYWPARAEGMIKVYDRVVREYGLKPKRVDLGGGIYGKMPDSLREQLGFEKQEYEDYALAAAKKFADHFGEDGPELFIEPGSAIAGDCMKFVSRIETFKTVRGKQIATVLGSQKNISMSGVNPPYEIVSGGASTENYEDLDIAGFTCIEADFLVKHYSGPLAIGDFVIISNCGSYSVVMKPPFILPNFAVIDICGENTELIKRAEVFEDLFKTYQF